MVCMIEPFKELRATGYFYQRPALPAVCPSEGAELLRLASSVVKRR